MLRSAIIRLGGILRTKSVTNNLVKQYSVTASTEQISEDVPKTGVSEAVDPLKHDDYFKVKDLVKLRELFDNRVHLGHKKGLRNEYMKPYLFGSRLGVDIINIEKTVPLFQEALNFTAHVAYRKGVILFVSRNLQMMPLIEQTAEECGEFSHCRNWISGTFTNSLAHFGAVTYLPDLCIFLSTEDSVFQQHQAVTESAKMLIPTVAIVDTSADPRIISYPIPGNDDSPCAVELYCELFKTAILKGKEKRKQDFGQSEDSQQRIPLTIKNFGKN